jgi:hypothetical protein
MILHRTLVRSALTVGLLAGAVSCTDSAATGPRFEFELATAQARWQREGPASYRITIARSCECLPEMSGPVVVTVVDGLVTARQDVRTGAASSTLYASLFPSVEGLFGKIESAVEEGSRTISVRYDPVYGFPTRILIDGDGAWGNDDEVVYTVGDFTTP